MVNQMVSTAVKAAERAASNAYTTCKEVFYTWQARTYQVSLVTLSSFTQQNIHVHYLIFHKKIKMKALEYSYFIEVYAQNSSWNAFCIL